MKSFSILILALFLLTLIFKASSFKKQLKKVVSVRRQTVAAGCKDVNTRCEKECKSEEKKSDKNCLQGCADRFKTCKTEGRKNMCNCLDAVGANYQDCWAKNIGLDKNAAEKCNDKSKPAIDFCIDFFGFLSC